MEKIVFFLNRQINDLRKGGLRALLRKAKTFTLSILPVVCVIPIVIVVRLLRPFVCIRFGELRSTRIGHYAVEPEMYLCERDLGMHESKGIDIFFNKSYGAFHVCNKQLKKMWSRVIPVLPIARFLYIANNWIPGGEKHITPWRRRQTVDLHDVFSRTKPKLFFTKEEELAGTQMLEEIGIPKGAAFVCFHVRDSAYLNKIDPRRDWRYHDYRNCNIQNSIPAVEELTRRGYYLIRMGAKVEKPLNITNLKIIDYAVKYRNDFLDIFLCAKCHFFIGCGAGIDNVSRVFRRPIAYSNNIPLEYMPLWSYGDLTIPKKLWLRQEGRFLTFKEIFDLGASHFLQTKQYEKLGIEVVENIPEEITALVIEMDERLKNAWMTTEEDKELQKRFWDIYKPLEPYKAIKSRVGAEFLRQNHDLLKIDKYICKGAYSNAGM